MQSREEFNKQLLKAAKAGDFSWVQSALDAGADVNCSNANGETALMFAAYYGHIGIVCFLLERKEIDIYHLTKSGSTALSFALNADVVRLLLEHCIVAIDDSALLTSCGSIFYGYPHSKSSEFLLSGVCRKMVEMMIKQENADKIDVYLKQINFILDTVNKNNHYQKELRRSMRAFISGKLDEGCWLALNLGKLDALKIEKTKFELICDSLNIIQKSKDAKSEKTAKKDLLVLIDKLNEAINLKTKQNELLEKNPALSDVNKFLDRKPVELERFIDAWLEPWEASQVDALRAFLATLMPAQREMLKKVLYQAIKGIADSNSLPPNYVGVMQNMRLAYARGVKAPLFELLRMGDRAKVDHDTGTWKDFSALMGNGNAVRLLKKFGLSFGLSPEVLAKKRIDNIIESNSSVKALQFNRGAGDDGL